MEGPRHKKTGRLADKEARKRSTAFQPLGQLTIQPSNLLVWPTFQRSWSASHPAFMAG
ncbi:succinate-semialdehyde dehydrogenase [Sesbania bispinosa]|nr:succinate-semialdehyde dehydrogenase [Sesbania bispinosa]